jgi:ABC-type dipeptide/oligopeptide/nickel transport system permease component
MGVLTVIAFLVIASNLLADVLYAVADPRIRYE